MTISLRQAARQERTHERFVKRLIVEGWLRAWERQGPKRCRFYVRADEVRAAINAATAYVPVTPKQAVVVNPQRKLHPAVRC